MGDISGKRPGPDITFFFEGLPMNPCRYSCWWMQNVFSTYVVFAFDVFHVLAEFLAETVLMYI